MTYRLQTGLFIENGPAVAAAEARRRRALIDAYYASEKARLAAARTVTGGEWPLAA